MFKPWHVFRKIYVPIVEETVRFANKKVSRRANSLIPHYEDSLSLDVLKLWENFKLKRHCRLSEMSLFLDFLIEKNYRISLSLDGFPKGRYFDSFLIFHDKGDKLLDYTCKLLHACGYAKDKIRVMKYEDDASRIELQPNEGVLALTSKERKEHFIAAYGADRVWNCAFCDRLVGAVGMQYMDVFEPMKEEIIINAGACDGRTDLEFLMWGGDKVKRIYSFEADKSNVEKCKEFIKEHCDDRVFLIPKGCWHETAKLSIGGGVGTPGSYLEEKGEGEIDVTTIDSVVKDEKVTFIKMDIEGAELNALKGAKNTIVKNRPRLAICVYHKYEDFYKIPQYILSLAPEYRFYLRHYSTMECETVLYAHCPEGKE